MRERRRYEAIGLIARWGTQRTERYLGCVGPAWWEVRDRSGSLIASHGAPTLRDARRMALNRLARELRDAVTNTNGELRRINRMLMAVAVAGETGNV